LPYSHYASVVDSFEISLSRIISHPEYSTGDLGSTVSTVATHPMRMVRVAVLGCLRQILPGV
jgi:hypothetical protein